MVCAALICSLSMKTSFIVVHFTVSYLQLDILCACILPAQSDILALFIYLLFNMFSSNILYVTYSKKREVPVSQNDSQKLFSTDMTLLLYY